MMAAAVCGPMTPSTVPALYPLSFNACCAARIVSVSDACAVPSCVSELGLIACEVPDGVPVAAPLVLLDVAPVLIDEPVLLIDELVLLCDGPVLLCALLVDGVAPAT